MKNFFKYAFFILLIILLLGSLFHESESNQSPVLDSNVLIVESNDDIEVDEVVTPSPNEANIFARIGAFFSNLIQKIFEFILSIVGHILTNKCIIAINF